MKVTREQIAKMNAEMAKGWSVDVQTMVLWNEKTASHRTEPDENGIIYEIVLRYTAEREGEGWTAKNTGRQLVKMSIKKLIPTSKDGETRLAVMYHVNFLHDEIIGEPQKRKMFSYIQKLTHELNPAEIIAMYTQEEEKPQEVAENDPAAPVKVGMIFLDSTGKEQKITGLSDMSIDFNHGEHSLFDFGTSRTIKAVLDMLGKGSKLIGQPAKEEPQEATEEPQEDAEEAEEETQEETTEAEETQEEAQDEEPAPDMFETLAAAYLSGKTTPAPKKAEPKKEEPQEEPEEEEPKEEKTEPGYTGETSEALTAEEITALLNGEQVKKNRDNYFQLWIAEDYNAKTALVYNQSKYLYRDEPQPETIEPEQNFNYCGFINGGKFYADTTAIIEEMRKDIETALRKIIPTEEAAKEAAADIEEWEAERIKQALEFDYTNEGQRHFFDNKPPQLCLYHAYDRIKPDSRDIIEYIENPAEVVNRYRDTYMEARKAEIYADYIRYNRTMEAYQAILENKYDESHTLKRIAQSVADEKTVKIKLTNGATVKVEAHGVKNITHCGYISEWNVVSCDRQWLPKNEYDRPADIKPADIVAIYHGQRTLYAVAQ